MKFILFLLAILVLAPMSCHAINPEVAVLTTTAGTLQTGMETATNSSEDEEDEEYDTTDSQSEDSISVSEKSLSSSESDVPSEVLNMRNPAPQYMERQRSPRCNITCKCPQCAPNCRRIIEIFCAVCCNTDDFCD